MDALKQAHSITSRVAHALPRPASKQAFKRRSQFIGDDYHAIRSQGHRQAGGNRRDGMRTLAFALAAVGWLSPALPAVDGLDVHGNVRAGGRPQPNTVVWLEAPHANSSPSAEKIVLDQRNLNFYPRVLAVRVGTTVDFPNNDRVFHNVFSFRDGKRFDLGMYPIGARRHVTFDKAGLSRLFCNIHPNMAAYVMAVDTPYFGVADEQGAFIIPAVPPATYTYHTWRPGGVILAGTFNVAPEKRLVIEGS
jgi:plastocyanin